jgi:hypothetical protein
MWLLAVVMILWSYRRFVLPHTTTGSNVSDSEALENLSQAFRTPAFVISLIAGVGFIWYDIRVIIAEHMRMNLLLWHAVRGVKDLMSANFFKQVTLTSDWKKHFTEQGWDVLRREAEKVGGKPGEKGGVKDEVETDEGTAG